MGTAAAIDESSNTQTDTGTDDAGAAEPRDDHEVPVWIAAGRRRYTIAVLVAIALSAVPFLWTL